MCERLARQAHLVEQFARQAIDKVTIRKVRRAALEALTAQHTPTRAAWAQSAPAALIGKTSYRPPECRGTSMFQPCDGPWTDP
jgi:hypothetical protein